MRQSLINLAVYGIIDSISDYPVDNGFGHIRPTGSGYSDKPDNPAEIKGKSAPVDLS